MQLKMFQYDTFRRHARSYIEPAIIHTWKTVQDGMMEQLSQQESVILGGDLRADSPGIQDSLIHCTLIFLFRNVVTMKYNKVICKM